MKQEIEETDWVYLKGNQEIAYKVLRINNIDLGKKAEICDNNGVREYEHINDLILITDPIKIQALETELQSKIGS